MIIHTVQEGDTLVGIANFYGVSVALLINDNALNPLEPLVTGQTLIVLFPETVYTVTEGDTVESIAQAFGISENEIFRNNYILKGKDTIYPGQTLVIKYKFEDRREIKTNGYAYPFVDKNVLRTQLPYMTYVSPFTYGITYEGDVVNLDDEEIIALANDYNVKPLLHLSTLTPEGSFSNELASIILNNNDLQDILIDRILVIMNEKGYRGLDIDFEYVYSKDRFKYPEFIEKLKTSLNPFGYIVIAALAPKTSDNQAGSVYEGHDYYAVAQAANEVLLMTYEWGYTYHHS